MDYHRAIQANSEGSAKPVTDRQMEPVGPRTIKVSRRVALHHFAAGGFVTKHVFVCGSLPHS